MPEELAEQVKRQTINRATTEAMVDRLHLDPYWYPSHQMEALIQLLLQQSLFTERISIVFTALMVLLLAALELQEALGVGRQLAQGVVEVVAELHPQMLLATVEQEGKDSLSRKIAATQNLLPAAAEALELAAVMAELVLHMATEEAVARLLLLQQQALVVTVHFQEAVAVAVGQV